MISVIVPVYKAEKYLDRCIKSILNQTYHNLELILVDDGSPDNCPALCDQWANKDNRIRVIHQNNAGVAAARNAGIDAAKGEYIAFVDSDDWIDPDMYAALINTNADIAMCDCIKEFGTHQMIYSHDIRPGFYTADQLRVEYYPHLLIKPTVEYPPTISNWVCLFRRTAKNAAIRYAAGIRYSEDLLFGAQMMYAATSFCYLKGETYYHYNCENALSATHRIVPDKWNDYSKLHTCIHNHFAACSDYDFSHQINLCLLFFVYNAVGELLSSGQVDKAKAILKDTSVRAMFKNLKISKLPISWKLKARTWMYKCRIGLFFIQRYVK